MLPLLLCCWCASRLFLFFSLLLLRFGVKCAYSAYSREWRVENLESSLYVALVYHACVWVSGDIYRAVLRLFLLHFFSCFLALSFIFGFSCFVLIFKRRVGIGDFFDEATRRVGGGGCIFPASSCSSSFSVVLVYFLLIYFYFNVLSQTTGTRTQVK